MDLYATQQRKYYKGNKSLPKRARCFISRQRSYAEDIRIKKQNKHSVLFCTFILYSAIMTEEKENNIVKENPVIRKTWIAARI